ncbi:MAG: uncharacterized protein KVP18_000053 [Porospora cf. gigantea A]|uniref:uncharacterized protein n=1 Tax=Porospora cf. gigantea A TaxID=2853593 RepID=UPI0035599790|nr:MAG: hypothetical protein KVP18_000053 [Porospora cf. gigantea A]
MSRIAKYYLISLALAQFNTVRIPAGYHPRGKVWRTVRSEGRVPIGSECRPEVRLLHVQDATSKELVENMRENRVVESLLDSLKSDYGEVQYGLSTFSDKPAPLTGYGMGYSVWQPQWNRIVTDQCYSNALPMSSAAGIANIWNKVHISGVKDSEENQLDALARAAVDPVHWRDGNATHNDEGQPIARLALMVTNAFAHHGLKNDQGPLGFDVTFKASMSYWEDNFGYYWEDNENYRIKSDFVGAYLPIPYGPDGGVVSVRAEDVYEAFIICRDEATTASYRRQTLDGLRKREVDVGGVNLLNEKQVSTWWSKFCKVELEKNSAGLYTGVFQFVNDYSPSKAEDIAEYPYNDLAFDGSDRCSTYEYPSTVDSRYADMFKKNNVVPIGLVVPPATYDPSDEGTYEEDLYRIKAFGTIANHCPDVRTSCPSYWITECIFDYGSFTWDRTTIEGKLAECYNEHYGEFFSNLERNGVASVLEILMPLYLPGR